MTHAQSAWMAPTLEQCDGSGAGAVTFLDHGKTRGSGSRAEPVQLGQNRRITYFRIEALRASRGRSQTRAER